MLHYVCSNLIYNSQKLERTQVSLNRGMDTEILVHLHNGVLCSYLKQWTYEILKQMDGSGEYHPEWGNQITKENTWYALTDKWILAQKLRIPKIQFAEHKKIKEEWSIHTLVFLLLGFHMFWELYGGYSELFNFFIIYLFLPISTYQWLYTICVLHRLDYLTQKDIF